MISNGEQKKFFAKKLLQWNSLNNKRQMPWKGENDPYKIWLSEIILQQTRVEQGLEYYNRFITKFSTIHDLAKASETSVYKLWEGLGYYSRCKNLITTAKYISKDLNGKFPDLYDDILKLKGVGPYTAAAIGSFAFNLPYAVVDGNVFRVLARFFGIKKAIDNNEGKLLFTQLANELLNKKQPGIYNQALMDFGATICKPQLPLCNICPLKSKCIACLNNIVADLPVKEKRIVKKTRLFYYLLIENGDLLYIKKRSGKDVWENLYEFVLIETDKNISVTTAAFKRQLKTIFDNTPFVISDISKPYKQLLSHQTIHGKFIRIKINQLLKLGGYKSVPKKSILRLPFPQLINMFLADTKI